MAPARAGVTLMLRGMKSAAVLAALIVGTAAFSRGEAAPPQPVRPLPGTVATLHPAEGLGAVSGGGGDAWVNDRWGEQLLRLDHRSGKVTARIPVEGRLALAESRGSVWALQSGRRLRARAARTAAADRPAEQPRHRADPDPRARLRRRGRRRRHLGLGPGPPHAHHAWRDVARHPGARPGRRRDQRLRAARRRGGDHDARRAPHALRRRHRQGARLRPPPVHRAVPAAGRPRSPDRGRRRRGGGHRSRYQHGPVAHAARLPHRSRGRGRRRAVGLRRQRATTPATASGSSIRRPARCAAACCCRPSARWTWR